MEVLLLKRPQGDGPVSAEHGGPVRRLATRMHAWRLDVELARGASPDIGVALSLRAHELIGHAMRVSLAGEIGRLLLEARRPLPLQRFHLVPCGPHVLAAEPQLRELAARLAQPGPVAAGGVARVRLLLRDGAGPVYNPECAHQLGRFVQAALDALELRLPDGD